MNFLYCFDNKYNQQAFNSISSILRVVSEKHNFYIIHRKPKTFNHYLERLKKTDHNFEIYEFQNNYGPFPRVSNTHVSEATYYRLFIHEYLPKDLDYITYVDADIVCLNDPIKNVSLHINRLKESSKTIAVRTEEDGNIEYIKRLSLNQSKYFNAGVMIIDFKKWQKITYENKFINNLNSIYDKVLWWDQDILNVTFDGNYVELDINLNFPIHEENTFSKVEIIKSVNFLHYQGKHKPWFVSSFLKSHSAFYQDQFKLINNHNYHLVIDKPFKDTYIFIKLIILEKELGDKYKLVKIFFQSLVKYFINK